MKALKNDPQISQKDADWKDAATELPDSDTTVLGFNAEWDSEPVWPCFHDSERGCWRDAEGMRLDENNIVGAPPTHWRHFPYPPANLRKSAQSADESPFAK